MSKIQTLAILWLVVAFGGRLVVIGNGTQKLLARRVRMVDGSEVAIEQVPWQVGLIEESGRSATCFCGGSIISSNWVITAAHCVDIEKLEHARTIYVSAGSADWREGSRHTIVDGIPHPEYEVREEIAEVAINDIALLQVLEPFVFDKTRQPISLYVRAHATLSQSLAIASGWGYINAEGGDLSFHLKSATMRVTSVPVCDDFLSQIYHGSVVPTGQICLQSLSGVPCFGDSGGPLTVNGTLVGINSWGNGSLCTNNELSVFTDVARYRYWISEIALL